MNIKMCKNLDAFQKISLFTLVLTMALFAFGIYLAVTVDHKTANTYNVEYNLPSGKTISIERFNYDGHDYIMFSTPKGISVIDDPDCEECNVDKE